MKIVLAYRILWYLDDIFVAPQSRKAATAADGSRASARLYYALERLGIARHPTKGVWGDEAQEIDHLGSRLSKISIRFTVTEKKQVKMKRMEGNFLRQAGQEKRVVSAECLTSFFASAVSLTLAVPLARFYNRSLYDCLSYSQRERDRKRALARLKKVTRRDLIF
eukprot:Plantae.Rhodophyta-Palmaria_palmata.ctg11818.p1 GENE.Plantae.Rhodophyta-Palmaria_palmata.ctg11818~~Plantae.Rhodophyta-Palmaria_palmata.ctg11818.p1  ORF type:complete len:165 (+),score=12.76 Plantae.Rhodophyta-Palmaria_palmata.ctg11818:1134-1628(+)